MKLAKKDGSWIVEYQHVKLRPVIDYLFQLPLNFEPLEEFDQRRLRRRQRNSRCNVWTGTRRAVIVRKVGRIASAMVAGVLGTPAAASTRWTSPT